MINSSVEIALELNLDEADKWIAASVDGFLIPFGDAILEKAKENVEPGVGPGPHPHTDHPGWPDWIDTGNLRDSLTTYGPFSVSRNVRAIEIGGDGSVDYGKHLEAGWLSSGGNFFKYPFLLPALDASIPILPRLVRSVYEGGTMVSRMGFGNMSGFSGDTTL